MIDGAIFSLIGLIVVEKIEKYENFRIRVHDQRMKRKKTKKKNCKKTNKQQNLSNLRLVVDLNLVHKPTTQLETTKDINQEEQH